MEEQKEFHLNWKYFLQHGGAGVLASVLIILIFLVCATWLKSLVFGLLLSCILLPLERYFEEKWFLPREKSGWFLRFRTRRRRKPLSKEETEIKERQRRVFQASLAAMITMICSLILVFLLVFSVLFPQAVKAKQMISDWGKNSPRLEQIEKVLQNHGQDQEKNSGEQKTFQSIRKELRKVAEENKAKLASFAVAKGKDLVTVIFHVVKELGILFFDVILSVFFGFYFLQKIAFFEGTGSRRRTRTAEWFVNLFYNSPWLPDVSRKTKIQTAKILTHIGVILTRWVRGYVTVISIEMVLYIVLFMAAGVPYALFAGIIAGLTVLLPFLGPIISFCLTVGLCLAFCENWLFLTLIFVALIYLLINGILEQFFLYPACIGEVSGLTTVETIIAVLAGGIAAGISGMIFAIPAAAIMKYLVPVIYRATVREAGTPEKQQTTIQKG